jgi:ubiquinone/menaquinone biosynthesis C-methylase UbiE
MGMKDEKTLEVKNWWNTNPFTYNGKAGVGEFVPLESQDIQYFDTAERKYIKHSGIATQPEGGLAFSKFINYGDMSGKKVLDIATGTGFSTVTFAKSGADVIGIDISDYAVASTKRNFALRGLKGTILKMDAQSLQFPDNYFDFVCAHGCLMHMPNTRKAVSEIYRVLKPGGTMYAWMYHRGWYYWFGIIFLRGILLGKFITNGFSQLRLTSRYSDGSHSGGNPHTKFFSRRGFKDLFQSGGFLNVCVYSNYNPNEWSAWPIQSFPVGKYIPKLLQKFLSEKIGFAYACSITAEKQKDGELSKK